MVKVAILIEFANERKVQEFEVWLNKHVHVHSLTILPDTSELYEKDSVFKAMVKAEKQAKKIKNDYINSHNIKS